MLVQLFEKEKLPKMVGQKSFGAMAMQRRLLNWLTKDDLRVSKKDPPLLQELTAEYFFGVATQFDKMNNIKITPAKHPNSWNWLS